MLWLTYQIAFFEFKKLKANDKKKNGATQVAVVKTERSLENNNDKIAIRKWKDKVWQNVSLSFFFKSVSYLNSIISFHSNLKTLDCVF